MKFLLHCDLSSSFACVFHVFNTATTHFTAGRYLMIWNETTPPSTPRLFFYSFFVFKYGKFKTLLNHLLRKNCWRKIYSQFWRVIHYVIKIYRKHFIFVPNILSWRIYTTYTGRRAKWEWEKWIVYSCEILIDKNEMKFDILSFFIQRRIILFFVLFVGCLFNIILRVKHKKIDLD
jgi:hypothetical protein